MHVRCIDCVVSRHSRSCESERNSARGILSSRGIIFDGRYSGHSLYENAAGLTWTEEAAIEAYRRPRVHLVKDRLPSRARDDSLARSGAALSARLIDLYFKFCPARSAISERARDNRYFENRDIRIDVLALRSTGIYEGNRRVNLTKFLG